MKNSFKQLFRMPTKVLLFFFLTAAATALLVVGSALFTQSSQRIAEVEGSFTTLGMIREVPLKTVSKVVPARPCYYPSTVDYEDVWGDPVSLDVLDFEGAEYLTPPENRPFYITDIPALRHSTQAEVASLLHVVEAVALEDSVSEVGAARIRVEKVFATYDDGYGYSNMTSIMKEGKVILVCQCRTFDEEIRRPFQKGKRYILPLFSSYCRKHGKAMEEEGLDSREYVMTNSPFCRQYDKDGNELPTDYFTPNNRYGFFEEVTEDFWEPGGKGEKWEYWTNYREYGDHLFTVAPVDDLQLLPLFQNHKAFLKQGREITAEEFESGALVCMLPDAVFLSSGLELGDKVSFSMINSTYGSAGDETTNVALWYYITPFNAQGEIYEPFWEAEYEIVGTYGVAGFAAAFNDNLIANDMVVIPAKSVRASDENNIAYFNRLKPGQATFLLPNGSIDAFETALHEAVPDLQGLVITYNDNGYEEIMGSLRSVWITALLLLAVGLLSALATLLLLLYFFIVKQKKRTAIERSLGMSKHQCRVSLLSGILVLALLSSAVGSAGAALLMSKVDLTGSTNTTSTAEAAESEAPDEDLEPTETFAEFSTKFSLWASESNTVDYSGGDAEAPIALFFMIPLALFALVFVLSLLLINRNLKIEPIYLLSGKME